MILVRNRNFLLNLNSNKADKTVVENAAETISEGIGCTLFYWKTALLKSAGQMTCGETFKVCVLPSLQETIHAR
jgi:hypothetical protein